MTECKDLELFHLKWIQMPISIIFRALERVISNVGSEHSLGISQIIVLYTYHYGILDIPCRKKISLEDTMLNHLR